MRKLAVAAVILCACSSPIRDDIEASADAGVIGDDPSPAVDAAVPLRDDDADGLDDAYELALANAYLPYLSLDPDDGCERGGLVVRVRKHPADPAKISIIYDHLFERDCGLNGHVGDNEAFGLAIDPALPAPAGILAIRTASHQATLCERVTECTTCAGDGRTQCDRAPINGVMWPVLFASKGKHGQYATRGTCSPTTTCFDRCALADTPRRPPIVNAGEPGHPLVNDLSTHGFITAANGWTEGELMAFDPWGEPDFGGAGNVADDLVDDTFVPAPCN